MTRRHIHPTVAFLAMSLAACTPSAHVDADDIEITYLGLRMDGVPTVLPDGPIAIETAFKIGSASLSWTKNLDAEVRVKQVRIVPVTGVDDLGFLETVVVTMAARNPQDAVVVASYQRPAGQVSTPQLAIANPQPVDVAEVWAHKPVTVTLALKGQLPSVPWSVDVTIVIDGEFTAGL